MTKKVPTRRKRVQKGKYNLRQFEGPFYAKGNLGNKIPSVNEPVWYFGPEEDDEDQPSLQSIFFLKDGETAFNATPTPHPAALASARSIQRDELKLQLAETQRKINLTTLALNDAPTPSAKAQVKKKLAKEQEEKEKIVELLQKVKTSTEKVEEMTAIQSRPKFERAKAGELRKGNLPVLAEYDRKDDQIKLFFAGAREKDGDLVNCPPEKQQCLTIVPALKAVLSQYTDSTQPNQGQLGYWSVSSWDWPNVSRELSKFQKVRVFGSPDVDLAAKFRSLDARAKKVSSQSILIPDKFPPKKGKDSDGKVVDFQLDGIKFLMSRDHAILADDMGLGKTYQAIVAAHSSVPKSEQILILCPAAVVSNWLADIEKFAPGAPAVGLSSKFIATEGEPSKRPEKVRFLVCSYQGASSQEGNAAVSKLLLSRSWGLVVLDEAHRLKKPGTLGHKFVEKLKTSRMWFLTGTPISNRIIDYYGLLRLAHHPLGTRIEGFKEQYVGGAIKAGRVEVSEDIELQQKLGEQLAGYVLRRTKEGVLKHDLPSKFGGVAQAPRGFINVQLPREFERKLQLARDAKVPRERLRHALAVAKAPTTWEVAERVIDAGDKVVLFTTYTDVIHAFEEFCNDAKVLYVVVSGEISTVGKGVMVKLFQGEPLDDKKGETKWAKKNLGQWFLNLVHYVPVSEWKKEDIAEAESRFGKDDKKWPHEIQVVLAQMVAASEGVTLTKADTLLFNDLDYMPSRHEQAEDRIYRLSKPGIPLPHNAVYIGYMISNDPLDLDTSTLLGILAKRDEIQAVYGSTSEDPQGEYAKLRESFTKDLKKASADVAAAKRRRDEARKTRKKSSPKKNPNATLGL